MKNFSLPLLIGLALSGGAARAQDAPQTPAATDGATTAMSESLLQWIPAMSNIPDRNALDPVLGTLRVTMRAQQRQIPGEAGLVAQLDVVNTTDEGIELFSLLDNLRLRLWNKNGDWWLPFRHYRHWSLGQRNKPEKLITPFQLLNVTVNGRTLTEDELEQRYLPLPPRGQLSIHFAIQRAVPIPHKAASQAAPQAATPTTATPTTATSAPANPTPANPTDATTTAAPTTAAPTTVAPTTVAPTTPTPETASAATDSSSSDSSSGYLPPDGSAKAVPNPPDALQTPLSLPPNQETTLPPGIYSISCWIIVRRSPAFKNYLEKMAWDQTLYSYFTQGSTPRYLIVDYRPADATP